MERLKNFATIWAARRAGKVSENRSNLTNLVADHIGCIGFWNEETGDEINDPTLPRRTHYLAPVSVGLYQIARDSTR